MSLNEATRRAEIEADKKREKARDNERLGMKIPVEKVVTLSPDGTAPGAKGSPDKDKKTTDNGSAKTDPDKDKKTDPIRAEALNILGDLIKIATEKQ